jgi:hypothetical protein
LGEAACSTDELEARGGAVKPGADRTGGERQAAVADERDQEADGAEETERPGDDDEHDHGQEEGLKGVNANRSPQSRPPTIYLAGSVST